MSGPRFTDFTAVTRVALSEDDWVDFRTELSFDEEKAIESGGLLSKFDKDTSDLTIEADLSAFDVVRLATWIADWSFTDADGLREPPTRQSIRNLNAATGQELTDALDEHVAGLDSAPKELSGDTS